MDQRATDAYRHHAAIHTTPAPTNVVVMSREMSNAAKSNGLSFVSDTNSEEVESKARAVDARLDWRETF